MWQAVLTTVLPFGIVIAWAACPQPRVRIKMSETKTTTVTFPGARVGFVLFLVFLVLKLTGVIAWSWWWVTAPLWIPAGLFIVFVMVAALVIGIIAAFKK